MTELRYLVCKDHSCLNEDDIMYNGEHYYRIYTKPTGEVEMISCTNGYIHNVAKELQNFTRVGTFEKFKHLLECD